ncbi:hypothetical protein ACG2LH_12600 [Zhouia sp. PK063]|uniref:hypothetical protein n=1 Tax=Zhouia sp. PK063 TaxID=3373602 RepID=UPI0037BD5642
MKKIQLTLLLLLPLLFSCKDKTTLKTKEKEEISSVDLNPSIKSIEKEDDKVVVSDTLAIKHYATQILHNEMYPSDNDETAACIHQLFKQPQKELDFYFNVFRVIVKKADGALAEGIGQEILQFFKLKPDYFIKKYSQFDTEEKNRFIGFMAFEFYYDSETAITTFFNTIRNSLTIKSDSAIEMITEMQNAVIKETTNMLDEHN